MKNPFVLNFENEEEKKTFRIACTSGDSRRVYLFVSIVAIFELFLLLFDAVKKDSTYSAVQWAYVILNSVMAFFSILQVGIMAWAMRKVEKRYKLAQVALDIYSVIILICAIFDAITGTVSSGRENLTMFFICLMLVSSVFYTRPIVVSFSSVFLFIAFEVFTHYTTYSSHHTYAPYPIFIIFIMVTVSFVRASQMKDSIHKTQEIKKLRDQAEHENQLKSQFLANMSHEIRTPMNAIVGMSELALDFNLNDSEKNIMRQIRTAGSNLVGIINDILDFSKIESGKLEIVPVDYDLVKMLNDVSNVCLVRLTNKPVELILEIEDNLPTVLHGDDMRIRQILINLAGNAAKFTEKGFVKIRVERLENAAGSERAETSAAENSDFAIRISVIDSGVGIRKEDMDKLFGAFRQVDMKMNRTKGGTGLGLSISKSLMTLMGGSINLTSEYGKGSCFYIDLPQKVVDETECSQKYKSLFDKAERDSENPNLAIIPVVSLMNRPEFAGLFVEKTEGVMFKAPNAKILVVDDNDVNLQVAEGLLRRLGVVPELCRSGYESLEKVKNSSYHIIFMDHQMPGMDGIEALEKIREMDAADGKHRIVVALSANAVNGAREMFLSKGFDDFLAKPVQGKDFASCLAEWLPLNLLEKFGVEDDFDGLIPSGFPSWDENRLALIDAVKNSGGIENYLKTAKTFYLSIERNSNMLGDCLIKEDIKNFTIHVHALKSAARIIGALELSKKAENLEDLGKKYQQAVEAGDADEMKRTSRDIHERSTSMIALYTSYMKDLRAMVEFEESGEKGVDNAKLFGIHIENIIYASEKSDLPLVEDEFEALRSMSAPKEVLPLVQKLEVAINDIEFETIVSICKEIQSKLES